MVLSHSRKAFNEAVLINAMGRETQVYRRFNPSSVTPFLDRDPTPTATPKRLEISEDCSL